MKAIKILIIVVVFFIVVIINVSIKGDGKLMPILAIPYLIFTWYFWKWQPKSSPKQNNPNPPTPPKPYDGDGYQPLYDGGHNKPNNKSNTSDYKQENNDEYQSGDLYK